MLSPAAVEEDSMRKGQHGVEAWRTTGSMLNSRLLLLSLHDLTDAGIVRAIHPKLLVGN